LHSAVSIQAHASGKITQVKSPGLELQIGGKAMPQIGVHLIKGVFNVEQEKQIIQ